MKLALALPRLVGPTAVLQPLTELHTSLAEGGGRQIAETLLRRTDLFATTPNGGMERLFTSPPALPRSRPVLRMEAAPADPPFVTLSGYRLVEEMDLIKLLRNGSPNRVVLVGTHPDGVRDTMTLLERVRQRLEGDDIHIEITDGRSLDDERLRPLLEGRDKKRILWVQAERFDHLATLVPDTVGLLFPVKPLNDRQAEEYLTAGLSMSAFERHLYSRFVLDRVHPYAEMLDPFICSRDRYDLQAALEFFVEKFGLASITTAPTASPAGFWIEASPRMELRIKARVAADAAHLLFRHDRITKPSSSILGPYLQRIDPNAIPPRDSHPLNPLDELRKRYPELTDDLLRVAYRSMVEDRLTTQKILLELGKGNVKFAIMGAGHEVCGKATALALSHEVGLGKVALSGHYRSGALIGEWARLNGHEEFALDSFRQMLSRETDPFSRGRNMGSHYDYPDWNVLPVQSALGMNIGKLVGYLKGWKMEGKTDTVGIVEIGDATINTSDLHEGMVGATTLGLPMIVNIVDNGVGISVEKGIGTIKNLEAYAKSFGAGFFTADGNDFLAVYEATRKAAAWAREHQRPVILWTQNLSRLNGHSSSSGHAFDLSQPDPLVDFGHALVKRDILKEADIVRRNDEVRGQSFFDNHTLGTVGTAMGEQILAAWREATDEPEPTHASAFEYVRPPVPQIVEPTPPQLTTALNMQAAIRGALAVLLREKPMSWVWGQDVGELGGVFQCTAGLKWIFPNQVEDSPINEELIAAAMLGFSLHPGATGIGEIQFADYALNIFHWLAHMGHLHWATRGHRSPHVILRFPGEPLGGGAIYHSMSVANLVAAVPGLIVYSPSTSYDAAGMLLTSAFDYAGPVVVLEPKRLYRAAVGPALPGEPTDEAARAALRTATGGATGAIPIISRGFRVPLGKAIVRKSGSDLTVVGWGIAMADATQAVQDLGGQIDCELIDLRTIYPVDMETVLASVRKTGRLLIAHSDRAVSGPGRDLQGRIHEAMAAEGLPIVSMDLGMDDVPGITQHTGVEEALIVSPGKIAAAARQVMETRKPGSEPLIWYPIDSGRGRG